MDSDFSSVPSGPSSAHRRRPRYKGRNPRSFAEKYKEHGGDAETIGKVQASGKTPAGTHRPIMVEEIMGCLRLCPGQTVVDCTLGFGGHSAEMLGCLLPGGRLIGLDTDPLELPRTVERLCDREGVEREVSFFPRQTNYAGVAAVVREIAPGGVDAVLADLGLSSMQIDNPVRGFSYKVDGPLDMRMNPGKGPGACELLKKVSAVRLARWLEENADEPRAASLAEVLAGRDFPTTRALREAVERVVPEWARADTLPRVFQAVRIAVNDEFSALDTLLRELPGLLVPGGRAAILTFHSGEDRRVKRSFRTGYEAGVWSAISEDVLRAGSEERYSNPRSTSAKLRWAVKA